MKKQMSLFSPEEGTHFTPTLKESKNESLVAKGFILSPKSAKTFKRKSRADGIYLPEEKKPLTYGLKFEDKRQRIPEWALPKISTHREDVLRIINENDVIGLDFEYNPSTKRLSILGVATETECAACKYDDLLGRALLSKCAALCDICGHTGLLSCECNSKNRFVGHFVLGADKPVLEEATGKETPLWLWEDSMISHYLCKSELAKAPGKEADGDGALGFMSLGFATHLWTQVTGGYKSCRGLYCEGPCPACLRGESLVFLPDGTTKRIADIVKNKYSGEVLTYDLITNRFTAKRVTGWYRTPRNGRKFYRVDYEYSEPMSNRGAVLTEDHRVLTYDGWVEVRNLREGDEINTGTTRPDTCTERFMAGILLGDSHITKRGVLSICHGEEQYEYLELKSKLLTPSLGQGRIFENPTAHGKTARQLQFKVCPYTRYLANRYRNNKKEFLEENFTLASLAIWFMDDGSYHRYQCLICCTSMSLEEKQFMVDLIKKKTGLQARIVGKNLVFGSPEAKEFSAKISRWVPACLRYKLHPHADLMEFDESTYRGSSYGFYSRPKVTPTTGRINHKNGREDDNHVFCIDVEDTHNFVTMSGVVHNCRVFDYCAVDAWAGLEVFNRCKDFMSTKGIPTRVYEEHKELALNFCLAAEKRGMIVDLDYARKLEKEMEKKKENLFPKGNPRFNPRSNIQVVKWFEKNGVKLSANDKGTIELALEERLYSEYGIASIGEVDDEMEALMDDTTKALYDLYVFKSMGKGLDSWISEKYITYHAS